MTDGADVCKRYKSAFIGPLRTAVLARPVMTAFYAEHGIENRYASWDMFRQSHSVRELLVSEEPPRIKVAIPARDKELRVTVDGDLTVVDVSRTSTAHVQDTLEVS